MENWIYLVAGAIAAGYILYRTGRLLFVSRLDSSGERSPKKSSRWKTPPIGMERKGDGAPQNGTIREETVQAKHGAQREKQKEDGGLYRDRFLVNDGVHSRVSTYVNRDTHEKIKRLLSNAAPGISVVSYINNILAHHLEQYEDEIAQLYRSGIDKPF